MATKSLTENRLKVRVIQGADFRPIFCPVNLVLLSVAADAYKFGLFIEEDYHLIILQSLLGERHQVDDHRVSPYTISIFILIIRIYLKDNVHQTSMNVTN